jgi:MFS transporter, SP family, arabinose:H+ symporter
MYKGKPFYLVFITLIAATGGFLFGFDMAVISGALTFVRDQFHLTAAQEGWFVSSALIGCIIGVAASGEFSDRLGRRVAMMAAASLFFISAVGSAAAPGFAYLITARLLGGIAVGIASNVVPLYISEIAPVHIRGRLVTCYQLAITVGILFAYISNAIVLNLSGSIDSDNVWAFVQFMFVDEIWRGMFGVETIPALLFLAGIFMIPESPRWLFHQNREEEGKSVLKRITGIKKAEESAKEIRETVQEEEYSYKELLKPGLRKALIIGIFLPVFSQFSGINAIIYYGPRILNEAGVEVSSALISQILLGFANMVFTFIAIWKVDSLGRRPLYLVGTAGATICLIATGTFFFMGATGSIFLLISVIAFLACFAFSIGPLKFVIASEIFPNKIRGRALALSIMAMWIADTIVGQITPMLLAAGGASTTFWFFAVFCMIAYGFVYKMVPETKGKSLEEIQQMWRAENK